jgi:hypothetical protein
MLDVDQAKGSDRKWRLFACSCCRSMFATVRVNPWDVHAVAVAERYADGLADLDELTHAASSTSSDWTAVFACAEAASAVGGASAAEHAAGNAAWEVGTWIAARADVDDDEHPIAVAARSEAKAVQSMLLRDLFGNPFRPVTANLAWLTATVVALARGIYDERAFDRMPILADALQDAGCDNADVLDHCRGPGPHVRGCWVVDMLLGKS